MERRRVRLRCWLNFGAGVELPARTVNVSRNGIQVQLRGGDGGAAVVRQGARVALRLALPESVETISAHSQIMWVEPNDRDLEGAPATSLGLQLAWTDSAARAAYELFTEAFRYVVLVVDAGSDHLERMTAILKTEYQVFNAAHVDAALQILSSEDVAVLLLDSALPGSSAVDLMQRATESFPNSHAQRIVVSGPVEPALLQDLVNAGKVLHYVRRPARPEEWRIFPRFLLHAVHAAIDAYELASENERLRVELRRANQRLRRENTYLRERLEGLKGLAGMIGESPALRRLADLVRRLQRTDATVMIEGETGTGKELVARALHYGGPRAAGPFIAQNCGGLTDTLLQSTLFGHRRGSFTGADRDQPGVFQEANGGTLFLDEVAELSPAVQAALLRALQQREVLPVGATRHDKIDVRVLSATHRDLRAEVVRGTFREDLYFRLVVVAVSLPPLRERAGDVALLAGHFLELFCERFGKNIPGFALEAMLALERYHWPGNVRELENELQRLVILGEDGVPIHPSVLPEHIRIPAARSALFRKGVTAAATYDQAVEDFQRALIRHALDQSEGVVTAAARSLGVERSRLTKLRRRLGLS